jgi:transcriptional regulator with XRE-family HTH domain
MLDTAIQGRAPQPATVLTKALLRAADHLGLAQRDLARILGISQASVSRLPRRPIEPSSKEGEIALLFLRLYRSLDALVGGDAEKGRAWFLARNEHVDGVPSTLVLTIPGLVHVVEYLDAMRGKL